MNKFEASPNHAGLYLRCKRKVFYNAKKGKQRKMKTMHSFG